MSTWEGSDGHGMNSLVAPAWLPGLYAPQGVEIVQCKCVCVFVYICLSLSLCMSMCLSTGMNRPNDQGLKCKVGRALVLEIAD